MKPTLTIIAGHQPNAKANDNHDRSYCMSDHEQKLNKLGENFEAGIMAANKAQMTVACHAMNYSVEEIFLTQTRATALCAMGMIKALPPTDALQVIGDLHKITAILLEEIN